MSTDATWLSVPEFADRINVTATEVREMLRERKVIAARRGENNAWYLPEGFIVMGDVAEHVVPTLRGTLTVLGDAGLTDDEALEWLLEYSEALGATPLDALRAGQRASVRRAAQFLM